MEPTILKFASMINYQIHNIFYHRKDYVGSNLLKIEVKDGDRQ